MTGDNAATDDLFGRINYRRFVAWESRIKRELPFLLDTFGKPGPLPLMDIACGTGEHAHTLTREGYVVLGLDFSLHMLGEARSAHPHLPLVAADMTRMPFGTGRLLGGALCLGNSLATLTEDRQVSAFLTGLKGMLAPGAPLLLQIINYHRIYEKGIRHLPLNFRSEKGREILYIRILDPIDRTRIRIEVLTLERTPPDGESRIVRTASRIMRPLRDEEVKDFLTRAGFERIDLYGDYAGSPYAPQESTDVIAVAR